MVTGTPAAGRKAFSNLFLVCTNRNGTSLFIAWYCKYNNDWRVGLAAESACACTAKEIAESCMQAINRQILVRLIFFISFHYGFMYRNNGKQAGKYCYDQQCSR